MSDAAASSRETPLPRGAYRWFARIPTRWMDNDTYGHVNNATYYSYFDTAVNVHLIEACGLDIHNAAAIGVVVETSCRFHRSLAFPETIEAGLRVVRLGNTSVTYELALFRQGEDTPAASGSFVHVWVDRVSQRPVPVPASVRAGLAPLLVD